MSTDLNQLLDDLREQIAIVKALDAKNAPELLLPQDIELLDTLSQQLGVTIPEQIRAFYKICGGLNLVEVYNGYFIMTLDEIMNYKESMLPIKIEGPNAGSIMPFGSDGGGNLFVIRTDDDTGQVLYLLEPWIEESICHDTGHTITAIAKDFNAFLARLLADVKAYIRNDESWTYIDEEGWK